MTNKNCTLLIILFLLFNLSFISVQCQNTIVKDSIFGILHKESSPYIINKQIIVPQDSVLIIEAGCKIIFQDQGCLLVDGRMQAEGTKSQNIEFKGDENWNSFQIYLLYPQYKNEKFVSKFKYCKMDSIYSIYAKHDVVIDSCTFTNCTMGFFLEEGTLQVNNSVFHHNKTALSLNGTSNINNCLFYKNENTHPRSGVMVINAHGKVKYTLKNNTIVDNKSQAIVIEGSFGEVEVCNSILRNNSSSIIQNNVQDVANVRYSNIQGGWKGEGNIDEEPKFIDPPNGDYHLSWLNYPIRDNSMSRCIDSGDPFSGEDIDGSKLDLGAFSFFQKNFEKIPIADFKVDTNFISIGETVKFKNNSLFLEKTYSCLWNFGDGSTSTEINPSHSYQKNGSFDVSLLITNSKGNYNTLIYKDYISVVTTIDDLTVEGIWTKEKSPYLIKNSIEIQKNHQLVVEPGVRTIFDKNVVMNINGKLLCKGTPKERIIFISTDHYWDFKPKELKWKGWKGLVFGKNTEYATASILSYMDLQYVYNYGWSSSSLTNCAVMIKSHNGLRIENTNIANCSSLTTTQDFNYNRIGGAVTCIDSKNVKIKNCYFENCKSENGGAICAVNSELFVDSCKFINNGALNGTAAFIQRCKFVFNYNFVSNNNYFAFVPANLMVGGTLAVNSSKGEIIGNIIDGNYSKATGGISSGDSKLQISSNIISNNSSEYRSSGIYSRTDSIVIVNNIINNNKQSPLISQWGGGMCISNSSYCYIVNNTIVNNFAVAGGGGIYLDQSYKVVTQNNIIFNNKPNNYQEYKRYENPKSDYIFSNNYLNDPYFSNYTSNDFNILSGSPCIDGGDMNIMEFEFPKLDVLGSPRISNNKIDIGAYEYQQISTDSNYSYLKDEKSFSLLQVGNKIYLNRSYISLEKFTVTLWDANGRMLKTSKQLLSNEPLWITDINNTPCLYILTVEENGRFIWSEKIIR